MDRARLSSRIKGALQERGWSQKRLADEATSILYGWLEERPPWATDAHCQQLSGIDGFSRHHILKLCNHPAEPLRTMAMRWCLAATLEALGIEGEEYRAIARLAGGI